MFGYVRLGTAVPELQVADCRRNADKILELAHRAAGEGVKVLTFPELCITGYTCGDLFFQSTLLDGAEEALGRILGETADMDMLLVLGMPVRVRSQIFNCAVALHRGRVLACVPKAFLPNHGEFYEDRWFSPASELAAAHTALCGQQVPVGNQVLFACSCVPGLLIGIEICADLWNPAPLSCFQAAAGATVILNLSASNEIITKEEYRRSLVEGQSARLVAAYVYVSCGMHESTTDLVFGGHSMIAENGAMLAEGERFQLTSQLLWADVDVELLHNYRRSSDSFMSPNLYATAPEYTVIPVPLEPEETRMPRRRVHPHPFVPFSGEQLSHRCAGIFSIQCAGLMKRLLHTGAGKLVLGISGGLDSTLALLCAVGACDRLDRPRTDIIGVTMPGFGTTGRTEQNARALLEALGAQCRVVDIRAACEQHLHAIGHDPAARDVTYENAQARERTQILMDIANMENGLVVGTGDLSELALGFCTYNGDHMSMYNVNCSIPKTLVRALVRWVAESGGPGERAGAILLDILDTPVSPELLPPDEDGGIRQITEDLVGPYELHDFFLYHMLRGGHAPRKILFLAGEALGDKYDTPTILRWMRLFYRRFFQQQFKRSCAPDGPKVGSVALSPRGDWRMPSDACATLWMDELDRCEEELRG